MNHCSLGGYLVSARVPLPADPIDYDVEVLYRLGCNRLRCRVCKAPVRSAAGLSLRNSQVDLAQLYDLADLTSSPLLVPVQGSRLYLCRCRRWMQANNEDALADPDPDPGTPNVPWHCEGHPLADLPHEFDGQQVTSDNLAELVKRALHGSTPPDTHPLNKGGATWAARMYLRLAQTPWQEVVTQAAADCLGGANPQARAGALDFVRILQPPVGMHRAIELFASQRDLFTDVPNQITWIKGDTTLEDALWRAVLPLVEAPGRARELARAEALVPGHGRMALYAALASGDPEWVAGHAEEIFRATPAQGDALIAACQRGFPVKKIPAKPVCDRLRALITAAKDSR